MQLVNYETHEKMWVLIDEIMQIHWALSCFGLAQAAAW